MKSNEQIIKIYNNRYSRSNRTRMTKDMAANIERIGPENFSDFVRYKYEAYNRKQETELIKNSDSFKAIVEKLMKEVAPELEADAEKFAQSEKERHQRLREIYYNAREKYGQKKISYTELAKAEKTYMLHSDCTTTNKKKYIDSERNKVERLVYKTISKYAVKEMEYDRRHLTCTLTDGTQVKFRLELILAGGYNIQRLHTRILLKEI